MEETIPEPAAETFAKEEFDQSAVLRRYYEENDFLLSAEGIMKAVSVFSAVDHGLFFLPVVVPHSQMVCIVSSGLYLGGQACAGAAGLVASSTSVALATAAGTALLFAGTALSAPLLAPIFWLYMDILASTVMGILLLVTAVLSLVFCDMSTVISYLHAPLGVLAAALVLASAALTYGAVTRRWDAALPAQEPPRAPPVEQDA